MRNLNLETYNSNFVLKKNEEMPIKNRKKKKSDEFQNILDSYMADSAEELEEYRVLLPKTNLFWDNGYEDVS